MQHKVKVTVIDKKWYPELQEQYCADPNAGACPCYQIGDEFIFERYGSADDFWHMGLNTLKRTVHTAENMAGTAGGAFVPHCSEAWDAVARYIYTGLQGGSIMRGWMKNEKVMIACCSDGTRPVIFRIERMDYKVLYVNGIVCNGCQDKIRESLMAIDYVVDVQFKEEFVEVFLDKEIAEEVLKKAVENCGKYVVTKID